MVLDHVSSPPSCFPIDPGRITLIVSPRHFLYSRHAPPSDVTSSAYLDAMTNAARIARANKTDPLDHVKWGRIDFITETELAARWLVFKQVSSTPRDPKLRRSVVLQVLT